MLDLRLKFYSFYLLQDLIADALGVPKSRVVCRVKRIGGGFGGKETRAAVVYLPVAIAAQK